MMKYLVICAITVTYIGKSWSLPTTLTCPDCKHFSYQLINIPSKYISGIRDQLSTLEQRNDVNCVKNTVPPGVCPAPAHDEVSTCETLWVKIRAIGIKTLPASGVELVYVIRACGSQAKDTADFCKSIHDLSDEAKYSFLNQVSQLKTMYTSVTFDGQFCASLTGNTTSLDYVLNNANPSAATFSASILFLVCVVALGDSTQWV